VRDEILGDLEPIPWLAPVTSATFLLAIIVFLVREVWPMPPKRTK